MGTRNATQLKTTQQPKNTISNTTKEMGFLLIPLITLCRLNENDKDYKDNIPSKQDKDLILLMMGVPRLNWG